MLGMAGMMPSFQAFLDFALITLLTYAANVSLGFFNSATSRNILVCLCMSECATTTATSISAMHHLDITHEMRLHAVRTTTS